MAVKNHSLDAKLINAAKSEFLEKGFMKASLHKIVAKAGITTGALYTRYKSKDDLFCNLITNALKAISKKTLHIDNYYANIGSFTADNMMKVLTKEESIYLDIMFEYYDDCILFFCRSDGSSIEKLIKKMQNIKEEQTIAFLQTHANNPEKIDYNGVKFIIIQQFNFYKQILNCNYDKNKAISCMKTVDMFVESGWQRLFNEIM